MPSEILLTPSKSPEIGFVTNPATPVKAPVIPEPIPSFLYP